MNKKNNKINVLHLIYGLGPHGIPKFLLYLLKELEKDDRFNWNCVIITGNMDEGSKNVIYSLKSKVYILPLNEHKKRLLTLFRLIKIVYENKISIINTHEFLSKKWSFLCKIFKPNLKLIYHVHNINNYDELGKFNILLHKLFIDISICVSKIVKESSLAHGIKKSILIYNCIDIPEYSFNKKNISFNGNLNIINVGRLHLETKAQDILLKALAELKERKINFKCEFVGTTSNEIDNHSEKKLIELTKELGLENEVNFLGAKFNIPELLGKSNLFILSSKIEPFGLVILEAMASGLPIIASNVDGPAELIKSGQNGLLFESANYIDLADKICELYYNPQKMQEIAQNGFDFVQNFNSPVMCKQYTDAIFNLIGLSSSRVNYE